MMRTLPLAVVCLAVAITGLPILARQQAVESQTPSDAFAAIFDAFRTHDVVMISDPHGRQQMQSFLLTLLRDVRVVSRVQDVVVEGGNARYQDIVDRFVRGDSVDQETLRKAWEDTTVPNAVGTETEELIRTVRQVNGAIPAERRLRVLLGDPPIDWDNITSREEHFRWIELRDSYPADVIRRQVLERGRKALVIYGQMHAQRRQAFSNYDMSTWQSQTIASLLDKESAAQIFSIWTFFDAEFLPTGVSSWPAPSLALVKGTTLGKMDFGAFTRIPNRFGVQNGRLGPLPRDQWRQLPMEEQFDAVLYIGAPKGFTMTPMPRALCADAQFMDTRAKRIALAGLPPAEIEQLREGCLQAR